MFVALDHNGNRLYANSGERYKECYCPECDEPVQHKIGKIRRPYFAHRVNSECSFGNDKDYKSEWHIRMQEYFPDENREVRFCDEVTGEIHIADVYLEGSNTVLEFQHSPIKEEEFISRTAFHLKNGRRIVWLFDESSAGEGKKKYGRFSEDDCQWEQWPYTNRSFKWLRNPRRFLGNGPDIERFWNNYSVCVFTGTEGDIFHRIVNEHCYFDYVTFSLHNIEMSNHLDVEEFFLPETFWQNQEPWKNEIQQRKEFLKKINSMQTTNVFIPRAISHRRRRF